MGGWTKFLTAAAVVFIVQACSSDVGFRQFEVGAVPPRVVYDTGLEVVTEFYTNIHGGIEIIADEEKLQFETGYIRKRTGLDLAPEGQGPLSVSEQPTRQKFYFRVLDEGSRTDVELLATYEVMSIEDPDDIQTADDLWKFDKQDTQVEDVLYEKLLERLLERNLLLE